MILTAAAAGSLRDLQGEYDLAFYLAAGLWPLATVLRAAVRRPAQHLA